MEDRLFCLSDALTLYQKSRGIKNPVSVQFLQVFLEMGYVSSGMVQEIMNDPWVQAKLESLQLKPFTYEVPISRPSKILCLGRNFRAHARELKHDVPDEPLFFSKSPSSLVAHESPIVIPGWLKTRVDHEAELGIVIGKTGKYIPENEAADHIAGYTIINDVTARDMQKEDMSKQRPWFRSKSLDTFCPMGPYLIPRDEIGDPHALRIELRVNGELRQNASTSDMIFSVPVLIATLSRFMTLLPGDVIATGTPEGVSPITPGDVVEISIDGLGTLRNPVVLEDRPD